MAANAILSVTALDFNTLSVLFGNGGLNQLTLDGSPLTASYRLVPTTAPAVTPNVVAISAIGLSGSSMLGVTLKTDIELSPGVTYTLVTSGILGIATDNVHNVGAFVARNFGFPNDRKFNLIDWVPRLNKFEDTTGELQAFVSCLQEPLNLLVNDIDHWIDILDADVAPENFVDLMLADLANPFVFSKPLTLTQKRRLAVSLVAIYKLKGTVLGCQTAIQFFLGMQSEFVPLSGLGNRLNMAGGPYNAALSSTGHSLIAPHTTFKLGSHRPWRFLIKVGTTVRSQTDAGQVSPTPAAGGPLTDDQREQITRILAIMKPAYMIRTATGTSKETGPSPTVRAAILKSGSGVSLRMKLIPGVASQYSFFEGETPGVNEYNAANVISSGTLSGDYFIASFIVPSSTPRYWNGVGRNDTYGTVGLLANELTNALAQPVVTATPGLRKISLTWPAVPGATAYRIYRSTHAALLPCDADNADSPIEISSDFTTYDDAQETGTKKYYIVTPVAGDSEGFYSAEVNATAA